MLKGIGLFAGFMLAIGIVILAPFYVYKIMGPKYEEVRRDIYDESRSYQQGTLRDLQNLQIKYEESDDNVREILRDTILHRSADFPENKLTPELKRFIKEIR